MVMTGNAKKVLFHHSEVMAWTHFRHWFCCMSLAWKNCWPNWMCQRLKRYDIGFTLCGWIIYLWEKLFNFQENNYGSGHWMTWFYWSISNWLFPLLCFSQLRRPTLPYMRESIPRCLCQVCNRLYSIKWCLWAWVQNYVFQIMNS